MIGNIQVNGHYDMQRAFIDLKNPPFQTIDMTSVIGYLVRPLDPEATVKDVLYDRPMHTFYPTFEAATDAAFQVAKAKCDRTGRSMLSVVTQRSEKACAADGHTSVFRIQNEYYSEDVVVFALYGAPKN